MNFKSFPFFKSQGDCDDDTECEGDLMCFKRKSDEPIPPFFGCSGTAVDRIDYCVEAPSGDPRPLQWCGKDPTNKLGPCQGDCDNDSDCMPGLACFKRKTQDSRKVPGCEGEGLPGTDYCFGNPPPTPYPACQEASFNENIFSLP